METKRAGVHRVEHPPEMKGLRIIPDSPVSRMVGATWVFQFYFQWLENPLENFPSIGNSITGFACYIGRMIRFVWDTRSVAKKFGVSMCRVHQLVASRGISPIRRGGSLLFTPDMVSKMQPMKTGRPKKPIETKRKAK